VESEKTAAAAVVLEIEIDAAPETVFEFFTDPDKMIQWMGRSAELDPRPGGICRVDLNGRHIAAGTFVVLNRPDRVVFTWGWEGDDSSVAPGASTVEIDLSRRGTGTHLRLSHRDLPSDESRADHADGWRHYFGRLAIAASGGDAGPDPWADPDRAGS